MTPLTMTVQQELAVVDDCWNRIGVRGDGSCPELAKVVHCHNCPVFAGAGQTLFERAPPAECVQDWTRELARNDMAQASATVALLLFRLGEEWLAVDVASMVEVTEPRVVHAIPHRTNRLLLGLVNIRGELQLCVSLRELLGIQAGPEKSGRMLVAEYDLQRWVFDADEVAGVERVETATLGNVPSTVAHSAQRYSHGVFLWRDRRVGHLSAERVFEAMRGHLR